MYLVGYYVNGEQELLGIFDTFVAALVWAHRWERAQVKAPHMIISHA